MAGLSSSERQVLEKAIQFLTKAVEHEEQQHQHEEQQHAQQQHHEGPCCTSPSPSPSPGPPPPPHAALRDYCRGVRLLLSLLASPRCTGHFRQVLRQRCRSYLAKVHRLLTLLLIVQPQPRRRPFDSSSSSSNSCHHGDDTAMSDVTTPSEHFSRGRSSYVAADPGPRDSDSDTDNALLCRGAGERSRVSEIGDEKNDDNVSDDNVLVSSTVSDRNGGTRKPDQDDKSVDTVNNVNDTKDDKSVDTVNDNVSETTTTEQSRGTTRVEQKRGINSRQTSNEAAATVAVHYDDSCIQSSYGATTVAVHYDDSSIQSSYEAATTAVGVTCGDSTEEEKEEAEADAERSAAVQDAQEVERLAREFFTEEEIHGGGGGEHGQEEEVEEVEEEEAAKERRRVVRRVLDAIVYTSPGWGVHDSWVKTPGAGLEGLDMILQERLVMPLTFPKLTRGGGRSHLLLLYGRQGDGIVPLLSRLSKEWSLYRSDMVMMVSGRRLLKAAASGTVREDRLVKGLFSRALSSAPCALCITQFEVFGHGCQYEGTAEERMAHVLKTEIMVHMEGLRRHQDLVLLVGVTSRPWLLDRPLRRRFQVRIYCPSPTPEERVAVFMGAIKRVPHSLGQSDLRLIGERTSLFSRDGMWVLAEEAMAMMRLRMQEARYFKPVFPNPTENRKSPTECTSTRSGVQDNPGASAEQSQNSIAAEHGTGKDACNVPQAHSSSTDTHQFAAATGNDDKAVTPMVQVKYTPCRAEDEGSIAMTWLDVGTRNLQEPDVMYCDVLTAIRRLERRIDEDDVTRMRQWHEDFGST
ncbi:uncharacterized protein LOC143285803 [Babylonia areolata]|uniref:uncharacterized protein LOC143285803 n=1 Tax=Babylonia areolata TaxID=304850 RepID=UPI003FD55CBC